MQQALQIQPEEHMAQTISKEYEDFAYSVSHDLNAPLRHIREFTRLLIGSRQDNLTEEERQYVSFLEKSLHKLDVMQRGLLAFSRLNTRAGPYKHTNINHAVQAATKELHGEIEKISTIFTYGNLPSLTVEPQQIGMLFFHLIDNALKFHHEGIDKRRISIGVDEQDSEWLFEIKDNGIGIAPEHHKEIFRLFRRLEPEKYPGVGVGLTLAQRIIQRHNGRLYIESEPGKGTRVFFTLPKE